MRICIPTDMRNGPASEALVYGHFGSAPRFVVYDTESRAYEIVENTGRQHEHGQCDPFRSIEQSAVDVLVTGGIGMRAIQLLRAKNVKVYRATDTRTAADAVNGFQNGKLQEITLDGACGHHGCQ